MANTEGWTQAVGVVTSHFDQIYRQLRSAHYDDVNEKEKVIKHLETKLREKDERIKQLKLELSGAAEKRQETVNELNEARKQLIKSETEAEHWQRKAESPCEKCEGLREQLRLLQDLLTKESGRGRWGGRLDAASRTGNAVSQNSQDAGVLVRRSPRKHKRRTSLVAEKSSGLSQNSENETTAKISKKSSQKSKKKPPPEGDGEDVSKETDHGNVSAVEEDTSPASKPNNNNNSGGGAKSLRLKSNKRGRTRYKEESPGDVKKPRLSPSAGFVPPAPPVGDNRVTQVSDNAEPAVGDNRVTEVGEIRVRRNKLLPDTESEARTDPVLALDTCQQSEKAKKKPPKRSSSSDLDGDLPPLVVPESVPHDFTVIDSDNDNDSVEAQTTVKEAKVMRSRNEAVRKPKKLSIRAISTDDDTTNESAQTDAASPVFGQSASLATSVTRSKRGSSTAKSGSLSEKRSLESPCLFDEEDAGKSAQKAVGNNLDISYDGLNIKRKSSRKAGSKVKSPVVKEVKKVQKKMEPNKNGIQGDSGHCNGNRSVLKDVHNTTALDESRSPSVLSGKLLKARNSPKGCDNKSLEGHQKEQKSPTAQYSAKRQNLPKNAHKNVDDLDETTSPSVISGKIKNFTAQPPAQPQSQRRSDTGNHGNHDAWLNTTPNRNSPSLPRAAGMGETLDLEHDVDSDNLPTKSKVKNRRKSSLIGSMDFTSSPPVMGGKKMVQSKITEGFFKKQKTDLTLNPDFNGGNLNNSFNSPKPLTPQEIEEREMLEAIKRSLEEAGQGHLQGHSENQGHLQGQDHSEVEGHLQGQGYSDVEGHLQGQVDLQVMDPVSFSQMTGPAFTSTPFVSVKVGKKKEKSQNSQELFKRPPIPAKQARTPKRNKAQSENDSPRRSPRLNKTRSSSTESSSPEGEGQRGQGPRSRKQLDLDSETQGHGLGQITMVTGGDLNGSIDPNLRFSEFDGDESHLVGKSTGSYQNAMHSGTSSKTDVFSRTGAFDVTGSGRSAGSVKSHVMSRTGVYVDDQGSHDEDDEGSHDSLEPDAPSGGDSESEDEESRPRDVTEDDYQEPISLVEMDGDVQSVPMEEFISQNQRSRATRVTPRSKVKTWSESKVMSRSEAKVKVIQQQEESEEDSEDDLECTGTSVVFGKKASPSQKAAKQKAKAKLMDDSFDRVPKKQTGPDYKYHEVVRKRAERQKLQTFTCYECQQWYEGMKKAGYSEAEMEERLRACRHKAKFRPPDTPPHYWELDFPDTQECQERGLLNTTQHKPGLRRRRGLRKLFRTEQEELNDSQDEPQ